MSQHEYPMNNGRQVMLEVPAPCSAPPIYVVAGHKTGSVLLTNIITEIAAETGLPAIPVESSIWTQGFAIKDWSQEIYSLIQQPGYVYYSFRWLQKLPDLPAFQGAKKIFMVRDPRDVAVSGYYSISKSHNIPKQGASKESMTQLREESQRMDIDSFLRDGKLGPMIRNIERFVPYLGDETATFYKYEDVIFDKRNWVARIARDLGVDLPEAAAHRIADKHDIRPEKEDESAHIRRVTPGGWRDKLSDETVAYLRKTHAPLFEAFGYD